MNDDPQKIEWDALVIGTGMGGAALGHALAAAGRRVLFCEAGRAGLGPEALRGDYAESLALQHPERPLDATLAAAGRQTERIEEQADGRVFGFRPFLGAGGGGSTALYGAALERFLPSDFESDERTTDDPDRLPRRWPFGFETLVPWYEKVERLFGLRGTPDPLRSSEPQPLLAPPPPPCAANRQLIEHLEARGLHPYRLPLALGFESGCTSCQGYLCARGCKRDAASVFLRPALEELGATLLDDCRVTRLAAGRRRVEHVEAVWRGQALRLRARQVILAAGALASPLLLLASGGRHWPEGLANHSGLVGRGLMRHFVDLHALAPPRPPQPGENTKEIAFGDFHFHQGERLGGVQSFGWMPPAQVMVSELEEELRERRSPFLAGALGLARPLVRAGLGRLLGRRLVLATTLEDPPRRSNRVWPGATGRARLAYRIAAEDRRRIERMRALMGETFSGWGHLALKQAENNQRLAHACGTCRMGEDPATSVVDPWCQAHGLENLHVVDAACLPTSGATNPSLTIAANALRVAAHLLEHD